MKIHLGLPSGLGRSLAATAVGASTLWGSAFAAELNPQYLPADAKWVVHVNQEELSELRLVEELREKNPQVAQSIRGWLERRYGIDPQEDLKSITAFSRSYEPKSGTIIFESDYDREKLESRLNALGQAQKSDWNGQTLYTVTVGGSRDSDDGQNTDRDSRQNRRSSRADRDGGDNPAPSEDRYRGENRERGDRSGSASRDRGSDREDARRDGDPRQQRSAEQRRGGRDRGQQSGERRLTVYLGDGVIVIGGSPQEVKSTVRRIDGDGESVADTDSPLLADRPDGAVIYGAAVELGQLDEYYQVLLPMLRRHERVVYAFGEDDGELFETMTLVAESEEVAEKTQKVLEGLIAYESLFAEGSDAMTEILEGVELWREGRENGFEWRGETEQVLEALSDLKDRFGHWTGMASR